MNRVEKYIEKVMKILEVEFSDGNIPKEYNGYISTFGAGVMMNGLRPTVAMFENKQANTKSNRSFLMYLILKVLNENAKEEDSLLKYILQSDNERALKGKILDIATAIKLCIRTFNLEVKK
jgi:CRISPR-associated protein Cmr5